MNRLLGWFSWICRFQFQGDHDWDYEVNPLSSLFSPCQYSEFITDGSTVQDLICPDKTGLQGGHKLSKKWAGYSVR